MFIFAFKTSKSLQGKNQKIIENILAVIFAFSSGNKSIINTLDILVYNIPCKNSEKLQKSFSESNDFISFLIFNLILMF